MSWRELRPGELDHEKIWFAVGLVACALGSAWLAFDLPRPVCNFKQMTGLPCPTCGTTRAVIALTRGDPGAAALQNPLVTIGLVLAGCYLVYAGAVVLSTSLRWRPAPLPQPWPLLLRIAAVLVLLANWGYLIWTGA